MKVVNDNWVFKVERIMGEMKYSAHYEVSSEGISQRRGMEVDFTPQEETQINNFIMSIVRPKVEAQENGS